MALQKKRRLAPRASPLANAAFEPGDAFEERLRCVEGAFERRVSGIEGAFEVRLRSVCDALKVRLRAECLTRDGPGWPGMGR